jgi:hypothetical protein
MVEKLEKWNISEEEDNLVFSFNGEKIMIITGKGQLHIKDDIIYLAKFSKEALDDWGGYSEKRKEILEDKMLYPSEYVVLQWKKLMKLIKKNKQ